MDMSRCVDCGHVIEGCAVIVNGGIHHMSCVEESLMAWPREEDDVPHLPE